MAAATLRGLARFWSTGTERSALHTMGLALGADVPMCIESQPLLARGIGEDITLLGSFPKALSAAGQSAGRGLDA